MLHNHNNYVESRDYTIAGRTITFPAGATNISVAVNIIDDAATEDVESFQVFLTNPAIVLRLGDRASTMVHITDNDSRLIYMSIMSTFITLCSFYCGSHFPHQE